MSDHNQDRLSHGGLEKMPSFYDAKRLAYKTSSWRRITLATLKKSSTFPGRDSALSEYLEPLTEDDPVDNPGRLPSKTILKAGGPLAIKASDRRQLFMMLTDNWLNLFLLFAIPAILSKTLHWADAQVFLWNFLVMLPLASLLGDLTEVVASHLGEAIGGIINATFGNAVELIVVIIAIQKGHIRVVQASLMGSIFSNTLLVLGSAMLVSGRKSGMKEVRFNPLGASVPALMLLVSGFIIMVTSIQAFMKPNEGDEAEEVKFTSRVGAVILIVIYIAYLIFSLRTHTEYFAGDAEEENPEELSLSSALVALSVVTALVSIFSDFLVGGINGVCEVTGMSTTFLGVVLLPIIGNAVEHWTAVICAYKGKMNLSISISLGSSAQISLFVLPTAVIVGWIINEDVTTGYPLYEVALFIFTIIIVAFLVQQGKANWLYGLMLICIYGFIALAFWYEKIDAE